MGRDAPPLRPSNAPVVTVLPDVGQAEPTPDREVEAGRRFRFEVQRRRLRVHALTALGYLLCSLWMWHHVLPHIRSRLFAGGLTDSGLILWWLNWAPFSLTHGHNPLYTHYINAPVGASAMWNTSVLAIGTLFGPVTLLAGPVVTFNLAFILGTALSAWTCSIWLGRHATAIPAFLGGLIFGFSPFVRGQAYGHLHLIALFLMPVIAMLLEDLYWRQDRPWWVVGPVLGLVVVAEMFISEEAVLIATVAAALVTAALAVVYRGQVRERVREVTLGLVSAAGVALLLLAWPLYEQFSPAHVLRGPIQGVDYYEAKPSYLVNPPGWLVFHSTGSAALFALVLLAILPRLGMG